MNIKKQVHQGEILMLLSKRSKMDGSEIALKMGISRNYLSDCYRREGLSNKIKVAAAATFGVDVSIFDTGIGYDIPESQDERVGEPDLEYMTLMEENARLKEENARMAEELLREKALSDDLRKVLVQITTQGGKDAPDDSMHFVSSYGRGRKVQKSG